MKKMIPYIFLIFLVSCENFHVEKVSSEEVYHEEVKQIDWKSIDEYPSFESCKNATKNCFEKTLSNIFYSHLASKKIEVEEALQDTLLITLSVSEKGTVQIESIEQDSLTQQQLPLVQEWLQQSVDSLPTIHPAHKRGIPVGTIFKLPIIISAE